MNTASVANAKVILFGEHAVVYGHPAIVLGIAEGASATSTPSDCPTIQLNAATYALGEGDVGRAYSALLAELDVTSVSVTASLGIPAGIGLGASAALGVAIARAVLRGRNKDEATTQEHASLVLRAANRWELVHPAKALAE